MTVQEVIETEIPDLFQQGYQVFQFPSRALLNPEKDASVLHDQEISIEPMKLIGSGEDERGRRGEREREGGREGGWCGLDSDGMRPTGFCGEVCLWLLCTCVAVFVSVWQRCGCDQSRFGLFQTEGQSLRCRCARRLYGCTRCLPPCVSFCVAVALYNSREHNETCICTDNGDSIHMCIV